MAGCSEHAPGGKRILPPPRPCRSTTLHCCCWTAPPRRAPCCACPPVSCFAVGDGVSISSPPSATGGRTAAWSTGPPPTNSLGVQPCPPCLCCSNAAPRGCSRHPVDRHGLGAGLRIQERRGQLARRGRASGAAGGESGVWQVHSAATRGTSLIAAQARAPLCHGGWEGRSLLLAMVRPRSHPPGRHAGQRLLWGLAGVP